MPQRNAHDAKKTRVNRKNNAIIGAIIALCLVFVTLIGVFAYNSFTPRKKGFSGGGGGISSSSASQVTPGSNGSSDVTLDGADPDVEIYSFKADIYDILIGETEVVTFTSEIFANIELNDTDVSVVDENGETLGYMNDNGTDGDRLSNDGIYTLKKEFSADQPQNILYYATAKGIKSNSVNICYYRNFGDADFNIAESVVEGLREVSAPFLKEDLTVEPEKVSELMSAVANYLETQKRDGIVSSYRINYNSVRIVLKEGYMFNYSVEVEGVSAGGNQVYIASYAPYDGLRGSMEELYDDALDGTAQNISNTFEDYMFGSNGNYNLGEVSLNALKKLSDYGVVIWGGHGGYDDSDKGFGSSLMTGQLIDSSTTSRYSADISSERILTEYYAHDRNTYCVTGGFFEKYLGNMEGAFVYLSACSSGKDMLDGKEHRYQLVQAFINKGASAVVGNSDTILSEYTYRMQRDTINRMCEFDDDNYYTLSEALKYAKEINGENDGYRGARPVVFPQNSGSSNNYRFGSLKNGYIAGTVKDAESGNIISDALVRIYMEGRLVQSVRTDSNGCYNIKVPAGNCILKISKGNYKTAKVAATVSENVTTYIETLLMIDVGVSSGFANGAITDAVSGQTVSGVTIKLRKSWNNKNGSVVQTATTNENGYYEFSFLPGLYTIEYSKDGYITGYKNIIIGLVNNEAQNAVISPEMPDDGNFRIVLSWSNTPNDLDSHLTGPTVDGDRFHLYYKYANTNNINTNSDYYQLDLDNTDIVSKPNIPETTTIVTQLEGVYRYSVHDYTNRGEANSEAMSQSNATVNVYKGSVLVATYHMPSNVKGTIWTVFELSGDEIKPINKIGNGFEDEISKF